MCSKMVAPMMMLCVSLPLARSIGDISYGIDAYSDSTCKNAVTDDDRSFSEYKIAQVGDDKHCYSHKGYSIKLACGNDDTVTVDHWLDVTGKQAPCTGAKMAGEPLMQGVPWETALDLFNGDCVWSDEHGKYAMLTAALPSDGFPKCDFTGASIRRLSSPRRLNASNATAAPTAAPTAPPTPAPTAAATNATVNTTAPTPAPAAAPVGTASGAQSVGRAPASLVATVLAMLATLVGRLAH